MTNAIRTQTSTALDGKRKPVISGLGATYQLDDTMSGAIIALDRAAGIVLTLPTCLVGLTYEFITTVSVTTNSYKVITNRTATEFLMGEIISDDTDTSDAIALFPANGTTHVAITMAGTTTGGLVGSHFRITCISATQWLIEGVNKGSSTVATPFATS